MRRDLRYQLDATALFFWESPLHSCFQGQGSTRDVSVQGAFIVAESCPPVETPVQVELVVPSATGMNADIRIWGQARVIRVEHPLSGHGMNGFAVVREDQNRWSLAQKKAPKIPSSKQNG